jgi:hypothetical protein
MEASLCVRLAVISDRLAAITRLLRMRWRRNPFVPLLVGCKGLEFKSRMVRPLVKVSLAVLRHALAALVLVMERSGRL